MINGLNHAVPVPGTLGFEARSLSDLHPGQRGAPALRISIIFVPQNAWFLLENPWKTRGKPMEHQLKTRAKAHRNG